MIVGAGPGGLSAALYMARFRRRVLVLHDGKSRALRIPRTHNAPGFPEGVSGPELITRMTEHALRYGAVVREAEVIKVQHEPPGYVLHTDDGRAVHGRSLILATGLRLNQLPLDWDVHERAIRANVLRYCPVCDGFEHIDKRIAVVGCDTSGASEALFLRQYTHDLTLIPMAFAELTSDQRAELTQAGIRIETRPVVRFAPGDDCFELYLQDLATPMVFDVLYPALGCRQRTELAAMLQLTLQEDGSVDIRSPMGTALPGLYCAGDIVEGLDQISVAMGHGAIAATRCHNWLRERDAASVYRLPESKLRPG